MITAIVLIDCATDSIPEVAETLADLDGVSEVYSVAGNVDLIAIVRVREFDQIAEVIAGGISKVPGVHQHRDAHRLPGVLPARPGGGVRDRAPRAPTERRPPRTNSGDLGSTDTMTPPRSWCGAASRVSVRPV